MNSSFKKGLEHDACGSSPVHIFSLACVLQVGFFKLIAIPMLAPFVLTFPGCQPLLDGLMANYAAWCTTEEAAAHGEPLHLGPPA